MTKVVRGTIPKVANGDISDHLRNHIHLTNCIHLKNHMHQQSPILADRILMRDLIVLQKSRSLRYPSASPPSWHSPSIVDLLSKKGDKDIKAWEDRELVGVERRRGSRRLSGSSPSLGSLAAAKVIPEDVLGSDNVVLATSDRSSKGGARNGRRVKKEESIWKNNLNDILQGNEDQLQDGDAVGFVREVAVSNSVSKDRYGIRKQKERHGHDVHAKTLSEQLNDVHSDSDKASSDNQLHGRLPDQEKTGGEPQTSLRGGTNRVKRRKFRGARRPRTTPASRDVGGQGEMSVASNSLGQGSVRQKSCMEVKEEEDYGDQNIARAPRNGCGIPWNWSRIHHRGKTFLDMAGRSLSCGLSDSRLRKGGLASHERDILGMPVASDHSSSSTRSGAEALPLLVEAYGSQESTENAGWVHDYSGGLGIYADHLLKNDVDSDLASEGRSGNQRKRGHTHRSRHQNLTHKYMPRTFRDLVGQNLVAQALSNAVMKRKVGLLYVFYGSHGTGKTSCARIFARALNCQSLEHPKPCGCCNSCIAHDMGKSRTIKEVGPVSNFDFENIMDLLDNKIISQLPSQYRVFIFDDCDTLSPECWSAISKVIDRAPRRVVFVLVSSSLEVLPHVIISRCQKFFFPKLKDADVIYTLQWISSKENIDIDQDALKLIASHSDGSLRDAEMTLEQLSLLGQKISVPLVQELVGLISDEKLVHLLDLALSADTVNTVKNLRAIMETGVEPLALMSQLATVITDIVAGSYDFMKERHQRKFFIQQPLSKEDMEKLRQALKTLSEAEKQLRMSNDKLTWLTATLLQLAPDQQYLLPGSSTETSFNHSPLTINNTGGRDMAKKGGESSEMPNGERGLSMQDRLGNLPAGISGDYHNNGMSNGVSVERRRNMSSGVDPHWTSSAPSATVRVNGRHILGKSQREYEEIWLEVLNKSQINSIRDFLFQEGKLVYISFGAAPTVQLVFSSHINKSKAEKFRSLILRAFEAVLGSPVTMEIRCESSKETRVGYHAPLVLPIARTGPTQMAPEANAGSRMLRTGESHDTGRNEIVEMPLSPQELKGDEHGNNNAKVRRTQQPQARVVSQQHSAADSILERRKVGELSHSKSRVRGKVSLAHVIQQTETQEVSIAEKLEQENLRLEPRSRNLLCWKASKVTSQKVMNPNISITRSKTHSSKLQECCISSHRKSSREGEEVKASISSFLDPIKKRRMRNFFLSESTFELSK